MHLVEHLLALDASEAALADAYEATAAAHPDHADLVASSARLRDSCLRRRDALQSQLLRLSDGSTSSGRPEAGMLPPGAAPAAWVGSGNDGRTPEWLRLLVALKELYLRASECEIGWAVLLQAAQVARDEELVRLARAGVTETEQHAVWAKWQLRQAAPDALVVR
jgi:hypothetical protein